MENNSLPIKELLSYSRIDTFMQCPMRYKLKYIDKNYTNTSSIALEMGSLLHKGMELKYQGEALDIIWKYILNGYKDEKENLNGLKTIQDFYGFEYYEKNEKSGMTYEDKIENYKIKLYNDNIGDDWEVIGTEIEFVFTFNNKARIQGKIDRLDRNKITGDLRVVDYKTNNKPFNDKDLVTPLQMVIYGLACKDKYGIEPTEYIYDMLFHNTIQYAGTKGFLARGEKKLNKVLDELIWYDNLGKECYNPKPTPLCYWCDYCVNNPNSDSWYNGLCDYYSLWTPLEKTFQTNKQWN